MRNHDIGNSGIVERRSLLKAAAAFGGAINISCNRTRCFRGGSGK
jgi:hypothetical protein